jgi:hypothetical protein
MKSIIVSCILFTSFTLNAYSFCGFYVAKADATLFNKTSQVILVRDGDRTTITMSSDFQGDVRDFAIVVPVPVVLRKDEIRTVSNSIFESLDAYSGPRLVEYWDHNPCEPQYDLMMEAAPSSATRSSGNEMKRASDSYGVKIEAKYTVGEYDILILSADESGGLETWLIANGYKIPAGAREVLHPYIKSNMKFFVVKVNMEELEKKSISFLSPLQISFQSQKFMLPIRLGMANAKGTQDMIVYAFSKTGRVETTNYRTVKIPTDKNIPEFMQQHFGKFYVDLYRKFRKENGLSNVYLEYAWNLSGSNWVKCDPCASNPPALAHLLSSGVDWLSQNGNGAYGGNLFFTRLHVTYDRKSFPQDLMFQETPNRENFQGRYIITHPAFGDLNCSGGNEYAKEVRKHRYKELQELAMLTGWDVSSYNDYITTLYNYQPDGVPGYRNKNVEPVIPEKENGIDTMGMIVPSNENQLINQGSFNAPFGYEDDGDDNRTEMLPIIILLMVIFVLIMLMWQRKTEATRS